MCMVWAELWIMMMQKRENDNWAGFFSAYRSLLHHHKSPQDHHHDLQTCLQECSIICITTSLKKVCVVWCAMLHTQQLATRNFANCILGRGSPVDFSSPLNLIARKEEISGGNLRSKEISCYVFATTFTYVEQWNKFNVICLEPYLLD